MHELRTHVERCSAGLIGDVCKCCIQQIYFVQLYEDGSESSTIVFAENGIFRENWAITMVVDALAPVQGSWGQHGAHLGPTGPRWAPCWPHELCYLGRMPCVPLKKDFKICGAPFLLITEVIKTGIVIKAWISNYIKFKEWDVIVQPWPNSPPVYQHWKILGNIWIYIHIHIFCSKRTLAHSVYHGHISYRLLLCKYMVDYVSWSRMCEA